MTQEEENIYLERLALLKEELREEALHAAETNASTSQRLGEQTSILDRIFLHLAAMSTTREEEKTIRDSYALALRAQNSFRMTVATEERLKQLRMTNARLARDINTDPRFPPGYAQITNELDEPRYGIRKKDE